MKTLKERLMKNEKFKKEHQMMVHLVEALGGKLLITSHGDRTLKLSKRLGKTQARLWKSSSSRLKKQEVRVLKALSYRILLRREPEGGYTVIVPALPGCVA